jgi:hypothetical protein
MPAGIPAAVSATLVSEGPENSSYELESFFSPQAFHHETTQVKGKLPTLPHTLSQSYDDKPLNLSIP